MFDSPPPESKYQYSAQRYSIIDSAPPSGNINASGVLRSQSAFLIPLFDSLNKALIFLPVFLKRRLFPQHCILNFPYILNFERF